MTTVRTLSTHQVVAELYPRPITPKDQRAILAGRIIDGTLNRASHEARTGRRPTASSLLAGAAEEYDREEAEAGLDADAAARATALAQLAGVLKAFRASPLFGLPRPRSRWVLVENSVGLYAQPDYFDGRARFYEMKSYRPMPIPPDILAQVHCFQLAFPGYEAVLAGFDRHRTPVEVGYTTIAPAEPAEVDRLLATAVVMAERDGVEKVVEYLDRPAAAYRVKPEALAAARRPPEDRAPGS